MKKNQHLLTRQSIILQLEASSPHPLSPLTLLHRLNRAGHNIGPQKLTNALIYLSNKNLISYLPPILHPSPPKFKLSPLGKKYLNQKGLI